MKTIDDLPMQIDVAVIGAGLSGINAAYRLQSATKSDYVVLEARHEMSGTWSLFNYPGIRSDSDMFTLGFPFRPWPSARSIADGPSIKAYIEDTAREFGIDKKVHYHSKVVGCSWDSETCRWTVDLEDTRAGEQSHTRRRKLVARFLLFTTGYYDYNEPLQTKIPGLDNFKGQRVHPQFWPKDLDYKGKKVVVIGSGATAVTLLPNMADEVEHITMLQRSPAYYVALRRDSWYTNLAQRVLPRQAAHTFLRTSFALQAYMFFYLCQWFPNFWRRLLRFGVAKQLPKSVPLDPHFQPNYNPWDQRLCFVPDGDLFKSLHTGKADIVTDHIETFTENAVVTKSGRKIEADIVVTATGLKIQLLGGADVRVDGQPIKLGNKFVYKGTFLQDVPNAALLMGYVNASWTLGSDISACHVTSALNKMAAVGKDAITPRVDPSAKIEPRKLINLKSNYLQRAENIMPKAGSSGPWYMKQFWPTDYFTALLDRFDRNIEYSKATRKA